MSANDPRNDTPTPEEHGSEPTSSDHMSDLPSAHEHGTGQDEHSAPGNGPQREWEPGPRFGPSGPPQGYPSPPQGPPPGGAGPVYTGPYGGGGAAGPPLPPSQGHPDQPVPPQPRKPFSGHGKLLAAVGITALITSLLVAPAAAFVTTRVAEGPSSSLSGGGSSGSASPGNVSQVADTALPSVVSISTGSGSGSGVVISSDGQILTNNHVVAGSEDGSITVQFNNGEKASASVVGGDPVSDIAVIKAEGVSGLDPAELGNSEKVEVGQNVVAIGSPLGLSGTVTSGIVSTVHRPVNTGPVTTPEEEQQESQSPFGLPGQQGQQGQQGQEQQPQTSAVIDAIQTDAPINPGNSGGPLMNMKGQVIGINTAIASVGGKQGGQSGSIGVGFAIPINHAEPVAEQLIEDGTATYAKLGASVASQPGQETSGALIAGVGEGSPAGAAGLRKGDVVTKLNDRTVSDADTLIAAIRSHRPGDTVTLTYARDGETQTTQVQLGAESTEPVT